ncbi:unnamed protein product [Ilex paraguariensis]|uniref:Exocyst subunit Exo70 family protein n=1 Tax=Ilex paraguariensis TaxID=185542 RepID=A0ABC8V1B7_9AQUA
MMDEMRCMWEVQMVFSALALAQSEVLWYFQHVGIASSKSKATRIVPVDIDPSDPTIGFLLDGMDRLCCLVRKYIAAIRGYALSYLSSCAGRIRFLLGTPGMVALDLDATLKGLFHKIIQHLENIPKPQGENISAITCDLSNGRKNEKNYEEKGENSEELEENYKLRGTKNPIFN